MTSPRHQALLSILLASMAAAVPGVLVVLNDMLRWEPTVLPGVFFRNHMVELGVVEFGERINASFELLNAASGELLVEAIRTGCGCSATAPAVVRAAERVQIPVMLDGSAFNAGAFQSEIWAVLRSRSHSGTVRLVLKGKADAGGFLSVFPTVLNFGELEAGPPKEKTFYVRGGQALISQLPEQLDLAPHRSRRLVLQRPLQDDRISVKAIRVVLLDSGPAEGTSSIDISIADGKKSKVVSIPVRWRSLTAPAVEPQTVYTAVWSNSHAAAASFTLRGLGASLEVAGITSDLPVKLEVSEPPTAEGVPIRVRMTCLTGIGHPRRGTLHLLLRDHQSSLQIPVILVKCDRQHSKVLTGNEVKHEG